LREQFVDRDVVRRGEVADLVGGHALDLQELVDINDLDAGPVERVAQRLDLRVRTRTPPAEFWAMNSVTLVSASSLPRPITMRCSAVSAISLIRWLDTKTVRPFAASRCNELTDPLDALGVEAVDRLVEHQDLRIAEHRGGDAEAL